MPQKNRQFTTISPTCVQGEKRRAWERFRDGKYVAIGWLYDENLTGKGIPEILDLLRQGEYEEADKKDGLRSFPRFMQLEIGDYVGVKNVRYGLYGVGIIQSGYKFARRKHYTGKKGHYYPHYREVDWVLTEYIPSSSLEFGEDKSWKPFGTIGPVYPQLPGYIKRLLAKSAGKHTEEETLISDLESIKTSRSDPTTKTALINARIGQGKFRAEVLQQWGNCCAVTGSATPSVIKASHIKPWNRSNDVERLDPSNGLPLVATLDALFDTGLISFETSGKMMISSQLSAEERRIFCIGDKSLRKQPSPETCRYLEYHRDYCFRGK